MGVSSWMHDTTWSTHVPALCSCFVSRWGGRDCCTRNRTRRTQREPGCVKRQEEKEIKTSAKEVDHDHVHVAAHRQRYVGDLVGNVAHGQYAIVAIEFEHGVATLALTPKITFI